MKRIKILIISFLLILVCCVAFVVPLSVKADEDFLQIELDDNSRSYFNDLPDTQYSDNSTWLIDYSICGKIYYNGSYVYFEVLWSSFDSHYLIMYINGWNIDVSNLELEDSEYFIINDFNLRYLQLAIKNKIAQEFNISSVYFNIYTNLNYQNFIMYTSNSISNNYLYINSVEAADDFYNNFGPLNSGYFQSNFYYWLESQVVVVENEVVPDGYYSQNYIDSNYISFEELNRLYVTKFQYSQLQIDYDNLQADYDELNNADINLSFSSLLGLIFMFPIRLFSGLQDVTIFGVNIYYLIVGIGLLCICIPLLLIAIRKAIK